MLGNGWFGLGGDLKKGTRGGAVLSSLLVCWEAGQACEVNTNPQQEHSATQGPEHSATLGSAGPTVLYRVKWAARSRALFVRKRKQWEHV